MDITNENISLVKSHVKRLLEVLHEYKFLVDSYIIEYFVENHWKKLPLKWRDALKNMQPPDMLREVFCGMHDKQQTQGYTRVFPLSLLAFKATCAHLSLPRSSKSDEDEKEFSPTNPSQSRLMKHMFRKHVKPKKQHEIRKLAQVILQVVSQANASEVVDIGAGQGYLSRLVSIGHDVKVTAVEGNKFNVERAEKYDRECMELAEKEKPHLKIEKPSYIVQHIPQYIASNEFMNVINAKESILKRRLLITGLHACGDLSATMIDTFVNTKEVVALVSVACCYMKLTTDEDQIRHGYPMSKYVISLSRHQLAYKCREVSNHANEKYMERLEANGADLKMHCYRAVLEWILRKDHSHKQGCALQAIAKAHLKPFYEYARLALIKLSLPTEGLKENDIKVQEMLLEWDKVIIYYVLCIMLSPLIETVILLDRAIYLFENGIQSSINSVFNPLISPRCFALIAIKK